MYATGHEARKLETTLDRSWWTKCKKFQCWHWKWIGRAGSQNLFTGSYQCVYTEFTRGIEIHVYQTLGS